MQFGKLIVPLIIFIFFAASAHAEGNYGPEHLTAQEIQRVRAVKKLLYGIDTKSLRENITELEKTGRPEINLQIREAMAKAYTDIVREINVEGQKKKEWLYSMVCLNMAYLQFSGGQGNSGNTSSLNRLIRQKLKEYLPSDASKQPGFIYSLE